MTDALVHDQPQYDRSALVEALVYHWPTATSGCSCGWHVLGHSFPEHVADMYEHLALAQAKKTDAD